MSDEASPRGSRVGMYVEIQRDIWPQLFDDLIRLPKGTARVQRLRALAYVGLLAEKHPLPEEPAGMRSPRQVTARPPDPARGAEGIFEAPLID
jgi:hypothetical protein